MFLESVHITNLRVFRDARVSFSKEYAGWHVFVGPNGSGKSTLLRSLALALTGPKQAAAARLDIPTFIRAEQESASVKLQLRWDADFDAWSGVGRTAEARVLSATIQLASDGSIKSPSTDYAKRTIWGQGKGWFSAAFGPYRRFSGGNEGTNVRLFKSFPKLARHLSIFGEDVALTEALDWLQLLRFQELELEHAASQASRSLLYRVKEFVNQEGFLPFGAKLESVDSNKVTFVDGNGIPIPVLELSDGYRSILSMTFELLRLMEACYGKDRIFSPDATSVIAPGVVLIDEIDVHLHPRWQQQVGTWLCAHFPNVQFLVTTHSPLICQQAKTIWRLPAPGEDDQSIRNIGGDELKKLLYGDPSLALETAAFGLEGSRSDKAVALTEELARLNVSKANHTLDNKDESRRAELQKLLEPAASIKPE